LETAANTKVNPNIADLRQTDALQTNKHFSKSLGIRNFLSVSSFLSYLWGFLASVGLREID